VQLAHFSGKTPPIWEFVGIYIYQVSCYCPLSAITQHGFLQAKYIAQCIEEIKQELRQDNISVKANAVAKLNYVSSKLIILVSLSGNQSYSACATEGLVFQLQMMGYDISWAGFNIIEVMSSPKFTYKRIGYLASSQCFHSETEVRI